MPKGLFFLEQKENTDLKKRPHAYNSNLSGLFLYIYTCTIEQNSTNKTKAVILVSREIPVNQQTQVHPTK